MLLGSSPLADGTTESPREDFGRTIFHFSNFWEAHKIGRLRLVGVYFMTFIDISNRLAVIPFFYFLTKKGAFGLNF